MSGNIPLTPLTSAASTSISFTTIDNTLGEMARAADAKLSTAMTTFKNGDKSTASALAFQSASQEWKFSQDAAAKVTENFGEVMKSIIQKA